jgi:hypothetical protein
MDDYAMDYENIVLDALGGLTRSSDILGLGDTSVWDVARHHYIEKNMMGVVVIIGLGASLYAVFKMAEADSPALYEATEGLIKRLKEANTYDDYCKLVEDTREVFRENRVRALASKKFGSK